jgi:hypothetical protein
MNLSCFSLLILAVIPTEAPAFLECGGLPPLFARHAPTRIENPPTARSVLEAAPMLKQAITDSDVPDP